MCDHGAIIFPSTDSSVLKINKNIVGRSSIVKNGTLETLYPTFVEMSLHEDRIVKTHTAKIDMSQTEKIN